MDRRSFLRTALLGAAAIAAPTKTYSFLGGILRPPADATVIVEYISGWNEIPGTWSLPIWSKKMHELLLNKDGHLLPRSVIILPRNTQFKVRCETHNTRAFNKLISIPITGGMGFEGSAGNGPMLSCDGIFCSDQSYMHVDQSKKYSLSLDSFPKA